MPANSGSYSIKSPDDEVAAAAASHYELTELEYLILGMVIEGATSGYAMRKEMNRIRGSRWSAESGAVYRVLRRLTAQGFVAEARKAGSPNRERTEYELTEQGKAALMAWVCATPDRTEFMYLVDPIRSRSYLLGRLDPETRIAVLDQWLEASKEFCGELESDMANSRFKDPVKNAAYNNISFLAQARHAWLEAMRREVADLPVTQIDTSGGL